MNILHYICHSSFLEIFLNIEKFNTFTKLYKKGFSYSAINKNCNIMIKYNLISKSQYKRIKYISYTKKGLIILDYLKKSIYYISVNEKN